MVDRRNFFEKLGRSLKLEDDTYPEATFAEQDYAEQDTHAADETPEEEMPQEEGAAEEMPQEDTMPMEEEGGEEEPAQEQKEQNRTDVSLAAMTVARKRPSAAKSKKSSAAKKGRPSGKSSEGRLTIDAYETDKDIVITSTVAGVDPANLEIHITPDSVSIRGERERDEEVSNGSYYYQECFWGTFSRSIILPTEIDADKAKASLKKGVLTIRLPKLSRSGERKLSVETD